MEHTPLKKLLAIAAHPDDLEFGCGGILLLQKNLGIEQHWLLCSSGESGTNGSSSERRAEAEEAADMVGATVHWADLGGDAQISESRDNANLLASTIREIKPQMVLTPTPGVNQHPDHSRVSNLARDAARLARYGGLEALKDRPAHTIESLLCYQISSNHSIQDLAQFVFDISPVVEEWKALMACHASQLKTRDYIDHQLEKARILGRECGTSYAQSLFTQEPVMLRALDNICGAARVF